MVALNHLRVRIFDVPGEQLGIKQRGAQAIALQLFLDRFEPLWIGSQLNRQLFVILLCCGDQFWQVNRAEQPGLCLPA